MPSPTDTVFSLNNEQPEVQEQPKGLSISKIQCSEDITDVQLPDSLGAPEEDS